MKKTSFEISRFKWFFFVLWVLVLIGCSRILDFSPGPRRCDTLDRFLYSEGACAVRRTSAGVRAGYGVIVVSGGDPGATVRKQGIEAITDAGIVLGVASSTKGTPDTATAAYIGATIPRWVRITWRKPVPGHIIGVSGSRIETLNYGEIVGDYTIPVVERIPQEVLEYANAHRKRAVVLTFRIKDDGVLFGWGVRNYYGGQLIETLHGGDFPCSPNPDPWKEVASTPQCITGYLRDAPWYRADLEEN
ncbi:MAG: hypothetical protein EOO32_02355 [Comamonadaceae bacterium]|nr:MAG: hypothetical protein EOO32_02355 [Comamonadaceae bacterium]